MAETPRAAQSGVTDALHDLSENSRTLVRTEVEAAQREMWAKAKESAPTFALLGAAAFLGLLSAAASYRLSLRLLEKLLPPTAAALIAAAGYGAGAGCAARLGLRRLREMPPLFPTETARRTGQTVADATARASE
ncbi:MAG TPA: phage holin family protein [Trebonia sp.]